MGDDGGCSVQILQCGTAILSEVHHGHPGVVRMKILVRIYIWWPDIDKAVEECARICSSCQANMQALSGQSLLASLGPAHGSMGKSIHIDFTRPMMGKMLFVVTDVHSKWLEVCVMDSTTNSKTISVIQDMFARYKLPCQLVSDNGPQFTSGEFKHFLLANGVKHITTAPHHPSSNRVTERLEYAGAPIVYIAPYNHLKLDTK